MRSEEDILTVHQVVRDATTGEVQSDSHVLHRWRLEDGLVVRMDVLDDRTRSRRV